MKHSPCKTCKYRKFSKLKPYLWFEGLREKRMKKEENGTLLHVPEKNYESPCWNFDEKIQKPCVFPKLYDDYIRGKYDFPPLSNEGWIPISEPLLSLNELKKIYQDHDEEENDKAKKD